MPGVEKIGDPVYISLDCRTGGPATGRVGIYLGDMPRGVTVRLAQGGYEDYPYTKEVLEALEGDGVRCLDEVFEEVLASFNGALPLKSGTPKWLEIWLTQEWARRIDAAEDRADLWFLDKNPMLLIGEPLADDQDIVWGCECWWRPMKPGEATPDSEIEAQKARCAAQALCTAIRVLDQAANSAQQ